MSLAAMLSPALAAGQDEEAGDIRREERRADALRAKILGLLVGSAIGDALGAPTEMWPREKIENNWVESFGCSNYGTSA